MTRGAEGAARDKGNAGFFQQIFGKLHVIRDLRQAIYNGLKRGQGIKGTLRRDAGNSIHRVETGYNEVVAFFESSEHGLNAGLIAL